MAGLDGVVAFADGLRRCFMCVRRCELVELWAVRPIAGGDGEYWRRQERISGLGGRYDENAHLW